MKQQKPQQNIQAHAAAVGINVANATQPAPAEPTTQQAQPAPPINPKFSTPANQQTQQTTPTYHDLTSGDREEQEQEDSEEALRASKESEQKRNCNAAKLIQTNIGSDFEGVDTDQFDKLVRETGGVSASSNGANPKTNPETFQEPKGKPGRPRSNQNLTETKGPPIALKPPLSRSPSTLAREKEEQTYIYIYMK